MHPEEKVTALIVKLNKLSSLGQIKWEVRDAPRAILRGTDDYIPLFMSTSYKGQRFGLFEHRYQAYDGEHERFYWTNRIVLALLDWEDRALWETNSQTPALFDLFETARKKVSNIDGLLDELLDDEGDEV
jgi:hypothetical protein